MTRLLLFLSTLCWTEKEKKEQENLQEAANNKRAKSRREWKAKGTGSQNQESERAGG